MRTPFWAVVFLLTGAVISHASQSRSLVSDSKANNRSLLVAAVNGLSGLDLDIKNVQEVGNNPAFGFKDTTLWDEKATVAGTELEIAKVAGEVGEDGTFFFYYTGHGSKGGLYMADQKFLHVDDIRQAIETGRKGMGPLARLVIMYDSCYSGSMVDPVRKNMFSEELFNQDMATSMANSIVNAFSTRDSAAYWKSLFVFASSRADETSLASPEGSIFTLALKKAFLETAKTNGNMATFAELTKTYTKGHHPVERFVPDSMKNESLLGN